VGASGVEAQGCRKRERARFVLGEVAQNLHARISRQKLIGGERGVRAGPGTIPPPDRVIIVGQVRHVDLESRHIVAEAVSVVDSGGLNVRRRCPEVIEGGRYGLLSRRSCAVW